MDGAAVDEGGRGSLGEGVAVDDELLVRTVPVELVEVGVTDELLVGTVPVESVEVSVPDELLVKTVPVELV